MSTIFARKPLARPSKKELPNRALSFFTAALCLVSCFVTSSVPIPMMAVWTHSLSLTMDQIALSVVSYFGGCVLTLIFFARLSNFLGRKPVVWMALFFGALASFVFSISTSADGIYIGRFFQGLSCGFASSAAMSWVVDTAPPEKAWLGTALTAAGPNIGLSVGTLLAGFIIQYNVFTPAHLFDATIILLSICAVLVWFSTETMRFGTEALGTVLIPKIAIPQRLTRIFFVSAVGFIGTWGVGSFFQGFSARFATLVFGESDAFLAALTYLFLIVPNATFGILSGRFDAGKTLPVCVSAFAIGGVTLFGALHFQNQTLFLLAVAFCGAGNGATCSLSLKLLLLDTTLRERAGAISALYLSAYVGSGLPNFVIGLFASGASMDQISVGFVGWIVASWGLVIGLILLIRKTPNEAELKRFPQKASAV